jgi:BlaI family transcriptional regulator, penicillinase repressor
MAIRKRSADQPAPTEAELGVLRVLWDRGASTVREVFDVIAAGKAVGYTTVLKQMQVMHQKGLLTRSERFRSHVYEPAVDRSVTQRQLASTILQQAFDGSARGLLQSALAGRKVDARELDEIRKLLDEYQRRPK